MKMLFRAVFVVGVSVSVLFSFCFHSYLFVFLSFSFFIAWTLLPFPASREAPKDFNAAGARQGRRLQ